MLTLEFKSRKLLVVIQSLLFLKANILATQANKYSELLRLRNRFGKQL